MEGREGADAADAADADGRAAGKREGEGVSGAPIILSPLSPRFVPLGPLLLSAAWRRAGTRVSGR